MTLQEWAEQTGEKVYETPGVYVLCQDMKAARMLYTLTDYGVRTVSGPTYWMAPRQPAEPVYMVTRDGTPTGTQGTYNECWLAIHKASSGASVEWQMKHEGYAIVPTVIV